MDYKIVFCDVDGTLLNSNHVVLSNTVSAINELESKGIEFVITSGRSPAGIYPILQKNNLISPIIAFGGALILDKNKNALYSKGFSKSIGREVIKAIEESKMDIAWNVFSNDLWIVKSKNDKRIIREEKLVKASNIQGNIDIIKDGNEIHKIMCIGNPDTILEMEKYLKSKFSNLSIFKSADILLEIMQKNVNKGSAIKELCKIWNIPIEKTVAFGDNYNDVDMLKTVSMPFLMENAPSELKQIFKNITDNNDNDGIYKGLINIGLL